MKICARENQLRCESLGSSEKEKNIMYMSGNKKTTIKVEDRNVDGPKGNERLVWVLDGPCSF